MLRCFPRVDAAGCWLVRRGRLCEDVCFGHDSRGEVPCRALDSENGSVHCFDFMVGVGGKGVVVAVVLYMVASSSPASMPPRVGTAGADLGRRRDVAERRKDRGGTKDGYDIPVTKTIAESL